MIDSGTELQKRAPILFFSVGVSSKSKTKMFSVKLRISDHGEIERDFKHSLLQMFSHIWTCTLIKLALGHTAVVFWDMLSMVKQGVKKNN